MLNPHRLSSFLATGALPERTALDEDIETHNRQITALEKHDAKYHGGHYDGKSACKYRDNLKKGDAADMLDPENVEGESVMTDDPNSPEYYSRDNILRLHPELAETYEAMSHIGRFRTQDGKDSPTRVWFATMKPVSKNLNNYVNALMSGIDVPDKLIYETDEWKQASEKAASIQERYQDCIDKRGRYDTRKLPDSYVCEDGRTRREVRKDIMNRMLADTVTGDINEACKVNTKTGKPKNTPYKVARGRRIDLVMGLPSAGKSSAFVNELSIANKARVCDSDTIKQMMPEFNGGYGANVCHEESAGLNDDVLEEAMKRGENIVYPLLGKKPEKLLDLLEKFQKFGYDVHLHYNQLPAAKAKGRLVNRWLDNNRFLDIRNISGASSVEETYKAVKSSFPHAEAKSNDVPYGQKPRPIDM